MAKRKTEAAPASQPQDAGNQPQTNAATAPAAAPQDAGPSNEPAMPPGDQVTVGRPVLLHFTEGQKFDGERLASGVIVKVCDDGTINVKAFGGNGGADATFTGVMHKSEVDAKADDDAAKHLPSWTQAW